MPERAFTLLITCEHASNRIPAIHREVARRAGDELYTHRGYDPGALELAKKYSRKFGASLFIGKWSRLLIELNRSLHHPKLWSEFSKPLPVEARRKLVDEYYLPYRKSVEQFIEREVKRKRLVVHIGVHSFTPVFSGETRTADIGLLYDPRRSGELKLCQVWSAALKAIQPKLRVRKNYPYRGTDDGFTTYLRKQFDGSKYIGIELEVNQRFPAGAASDWNTLQKNLVSSLASVL